MTAYVLDHRRVKAFAEALEAHQSENSQSESSRPENSRPENSESENSQSENSQSENSESKSSHAESTANSHARGGSAPIAGLLAMADALGALPEPELSAEARTVQRAQLMAAFEQAWADGGPGATVPRQRRPSAVRPTARRWGRRLAVGSLVAGLAVGGFAGAATASTNALPGDALYGMKRGLEDLRLSFAGSDTERGALLLDQAASRLDEARGLLGRTAPRAAPDALAPGRLEQVRGALDDMHAEALRGRDLLRSVYRSSGSLAPMRRLATFADGENGRWQSMQEQLPPQLTGQAGKVDQLFDTMSQDIAPLHLAQPAKGGGQGRPGDSPQSLGPYDRPSGGSTRGSGSADPSGGTPNGTDSGHATPGAPTGGVSGLLNGLTNGLTGGAGANPSPAGSPSPSGPADSTPGQGAGPSPLIPELLPGLAL